MNTIEIEKMLPHRHPFLFIDTVESVEPGVRGKGTKIFSPDDHIFRGSGIRPPIVPSGIIIEAMAQLAAVVCAHIGLSENAEKKAPNTGYMIAINTFEYITPIKPGEMITLTVDITHIFGPMVKCKCSSQVHDSCVATAELSFVKNAD